MLQANSSSSPQANDGRCGAGGGVEVGVGSSSEELQVTHTCIAAYR